MNSNIMDDRINDMIDIVMKVARGDYSVQAQVYDENDELDSLAMGLNMMIDDLQNYIIQRKKAEEELIRSNTELQDFAYVASHDLQEPLRMVSSYLQLLERRYKDQLDQDADEFIAYAVDGATRMQTMINDLLSYSRITTKAKPFRPVDSESVFKQAVANLGIAIEENSAVVDHSPLPSVLADESQLERLFQNLIGNAIKFHGEKPPEIHVAVEPNGGDWLFSVKDNGIGIDPDYNERIFKIFNRLHNKTDYPGTGIGLAECKKIVERHGGRIWVESEPGKGSTFYFTIKKTGDD